MAKIDKEKQKRDKRRARNNQELDLIRLQFAANVRLKREARGWSQEELADYCELHITAISKIERAESLSQLDTLVKVASALGLSLGELAAGISWTKPTGKDGKATGDDGRFVVEDRKADDQRAGGS